MAKISGQPCEVQLLKTKQEGQSEGQEEEFWKYNNVFQGRQRDSLKWVNVEGGHELTSWSLKTVLNCLSNLHYLL